MNTLPAINDFELTLIELEYATADFGARKASITKTGDLEELLSKLERANRAVQVAIGALGRQAQTSVRKRVALYQVPKSPTHGPIGAFRST